MDEAEYSVPKNREERLQGQKLIVILEEACLELTERANKTYELLNNLDHRSLLKKNGREVEDVRPDITHQCLLSLLDSPLNKAGKLLVYIRTADSQLIEISPHLIVPKTWRQFSAMMVTFLQKHRIKAAERNVTLLRLIKNNLDEILPVGGRKIGLSVSGKLENLRDFVQEFKVATIPVTFVIGAVAHGDPAPKCSFLEENISISSCGLSASTCCNKVCTEFENLWDVF